METFIKIAIGGLFGGILICLIMAIIGVILCIPIPSTYFYVFLVFAGITGIFFLAFIIGVIILFVKDELF